MPRFLVRTAAIVIASSSAAFGQSSPTVSFGEIGKLYSSVEQQGKQYKFYLIEKRLAGSPSSFTGKIRIRFEEGTKRTDSQLLYFRAECMMDSAAPISAPQILYQRTEQLAPQNTSEVVAIDIGLGVPPKGAEEPYALWRAVCREIFSPAAAELSDPPEKAEDIARLVSQGSTHRRKQEYDRAVAEYSKAIELSEKVATPEMIASLHVVRAATYALKGDLKNAESDYQEALTRNPGNEEAAEGIKQISVALASPTVLISTNPSSEALKRSPLKCAGGQVQENERCVAKTCPAGQFPLKDGNCIKRKEKIASRRPPARELAVEEPLRGRSRMNGTKYAKIPLDPGILKHEPALHSMRGNQVVHVDDGSCPKGQILQVTATGRGGNRFRACIPRN